MNKGYIKRIGSQTVDVQTAGSVASLTNVKVSGQVDLSSLSVGTAVLIDVINGEHVVLHTLLGEFRSPATAVAASSTGGVVTNNSLLADGSVPLTGNLPVTPGVTIDGYDISVLGQTIDNLQAADTIARTGWTAFSHSTHLVATISDSATEILVRNALFELYEQITMSNTNGEVEFMRIDSAPTSTVDDRGVLCYQYTVTRRVATSPNGLSTGWAASTLVNGLTKRGFITVDNRHQNSINSPNIGGSIWVDDPPTIQERVFRFGGLRGILDIDTDDFGVAIGNLDTRNTYLLFNASREQLELKNVDYKVIDSGGDQVVRMYGRNEGDRLAGDYDFGKLSQVHNSFYGETATWGVYRGVQPIIEISEQQSYLRDMFTVGDSLGARIDLGEQDNMAIIALRDKYGVAKMVAKTDTEGGVHFHVGNPPPQSNSMWFDSADGRLNVSGHVEMQSARVAGRLEFAEAGEFKIIDPDDPNRFGVVTPRGQYAYTTDSLGVTHLIRVDAWGPLVLEDVLGSGVWRTWVGGTQLFGDPRYRNFRIERGAAARAGFFNGDTAAVYLDVTGKAVFGDPNGDSITIDTVNGIRFFNPAEEPLLDGLSGGTSLEENYMITVWLNSSGTVPIHRISAWRSDSTPRENTMFLQSEPLAGERARIIHSALSDYQANCRFRAVGGYNTANQQTTQIDLWAYREEGAGAFTHRRIDFDTDLLYLKAYTTATIPGGTIQNGSILHSNSTYNPGAGAGVYIYYGGYWVPIALQGDATGWEAISTTATAGNVKYYTCSDAGGSYTVTLPAATSLPRNWEYTFKKSNSSTNTITIDADGAATIDGTTTYILSKQHQFVTIRRAGANWDVIAKGTGATTYIGGATNYSQFDDTGHLTFAGTAKPWNDMLIEPSARTTGANAPTFEKWYDDVAGTSRGAYLYSFDDANAGSEKEVFFTMQMSHAWDGGDIQFHVHWVGAVDDTTATPRWGLEYTWKEPGGVFGDTTIVYATGNHLSDANITANKHYITQFTAISPGSTANDLSSVLIGRLFRDSANVADTYNATGAKVGLLYIDAHYQMARIGSNDEYTA